MKHPQAKYRRHLQDPPPAELPIVLDEDKCARLSRAILDLAINDYRRAWKRGLVRGTRVIAPKHYHDSLELQSLRDFFKSPWFSQLSEACGYDAPSDDTELERTTNDDRSRHEKQNL